MQHGHSMQGDESGPHLQVCKCHALCARLGEHIGGVKSLLRQVFLGQLEVNLPELGVSHSFGAQHIAELIDLFGNLDDQHCMVLLHAEVRGQDQSIPRQTEISHSVREPVGNHLPGCKILDLVPGTFIFNLHLAYDCVTYFSHALISALYTFHSTITHQMHSNEAHLAG